MKERTLDGFGDRLAALRQRRGLTQTALGAAGGVSKRVIAYYEADDAQSQSRPPLEARRAPRRLARRRAARRPQSRRWLPRFLLARQAPTARGTAAAAQAQGELRDLSRQKPGQIGPAGLL